ncbi:AraC family transcriptional regulator [Cohnella ginsengisoli]|uniref:AraC family transcriptional regulator n=1 Tax=Cohnella ginsengisoli TaxID=425004 RepID=A0A9X4QLB1_9BACL|nr:helix-turn-helix transcriptional regulator [Cohnella ginsengisoli]MDG0790310.1 AraC family transcriptional regulator [Cohnella ginsengisoli]
MVVRLGEDQAKASPHIVASLYTPPLFAHLLEAGSWSAAREKLEAIFGEWRAKYSGSGEHLSEIEYALKAAFSYFVHKNGRMLADYRLHQASDFKGIGELSYWALGMLDKLQEELNAEMSESRHSLVHQIQRFLQTHLSEDVSLQAIADQVYMHPTHVSKVFKKRDRRKYIRLRAPAANGQSRLFAEGQQIQNLRSGGTAGLQKSDVFYQSVQGPLRGNAAGVQGINAGREDGTGLIRRDFVKSGLLSSILDWRTLRNSAASQKQRYSEAALL